MRHVVLITCLVLLFAGGAYGARTADVCSIGQMSDGGSCCCHVEVLDCQPGDEFPVAQTVSPTSRHDVKRLATAADVETFAWDLRTGPQVAGTYPPPDEVRRLPLQGSQDPTRAPPAVY